MTGCLFVFMPERRVVEVCDSLGLIVHVLPACLFLSVVPSVTLARAVVSTRQTSFGGSCVSTD